MKILLMNIIGRAIYRTPKNGLVSVVAREDSGYLCLQVYDTGYPLTEFTEKLIEGACEAFIPEFHLQKICQENGLRYQYSQIKYRLNLTQLIIPLKRK